MEIKNIYKVTTSLKDKTGKTIEFNIAGKTLGDIYYDISSVTYNGIKIEDYIESVVNTKHKIHAPTWDDKELNPEYKPEENASKQEE